MSVYTTVSHDELEVWLSRYALGAMSEFEPIVAGIENTNYFLSAERGRYVLTLYERAPAVELPFYLNLMAHLAEAGVPCPAPIADRSGAYFSMLSGKPAGLVTRLKGEAIVSPRPENCAAVGHHLARLHLASASYRGRLANRRGLAWWRQAARAVTNFLTPEQKELLSAELQFQASFSTTKLPRGPIHGDLFCDNVLFEDPELSGIIDFGFAAVDFYAYDLAITVNDWCVNDINGTDTDSGCAGALDEERVNALLAAYCSVRPLNNEERNEWPVLLRAAALRFWLSRLYDLHLPRPGELTHAHDPKKFEAILRQRVSQPTRFPSL